MSTDGVAFVSTRWVQSGCEPQYLQWSEKIGAQLSITTGFVSYEQLPAVEGKQDFWTQIVKFDTKEASHDWANSSELAELLVEIEPYTRDSEFSSVRIGQQDWLNFGLSTEAGPGAPTKWKQLITGIMALYPTVIIAHEILAQLVTVPFALSTLLTNAIAMSLVMLIWLPQLSRLLRRWLLPTKPLPPAITIGVAAAILGIIGACLLIFLQLFPS
jgi:antibiotic biosynthesis monooxygenase (ABM) superfamily enzyme